MYTGERRKCSYNIGSQQKVGLIPSYLVSNSIVSSDLAYKTSVCLSRLSQDGLYAASTRRGSEVEDCQTFTLLASIHVDAEQVLWDGSDIQLDVDALGLLSVLSRAIVDVASLQ
jgi:hypothetical protein